MTCQFVTTCGASRLSPAVIQIPAHSWAHQKAVSGPVKSRMHFSWGADRSTSAAFWQRCGSRRGRQGRQVRGTSITVAEVTTKPPVAERLSGDDLQQWQTCVEQVVQAGIAQEDAEKLLAKAFGWRGQLRQMHHVGDLCASALTTTGYWRTERVDEVPQPEQVAAVLAFLAEQGVSGENLVPAIARFPEVLALSVDTQLRGNVETLQSEWFVRGLALKKLLRTQPQVLGYNINCGGDCQGDCNRCWVRF